MQDQDGIDPTYLRYLFDYKDGHLYWKNTPGRASVQGKQAGRYTPYGYISVEIDGVPHQAHRLIWIYHNGATDMFIDHIDGNRSNNIIENLRVCTRIENGYNRKRCKRNTTGVKGIRVRPDSGKYEVRISVNKKRFVLGSYQDFELAELVMFMAREKFHGAFANHG
jgi:hypothetical protein